MRTAVTRALIAIALLISGAAHAHVGSPDVFFEGDAGPYKLFVTVRVPQVIPGVAAIEIRSESPDVRAVTVVPMRLTGPGSEHPPTADRAEQSPADPQFFTANLWLMERGSLQVRVGVDGARGAGTLAVPVPASAQTTLAMPTGLGALLLGLMLVLALAIVAIASGALREATLEPGAAPRPRTRVALVVVSAIVVGAIALGNAWWSAVAGDYAQLVAKPWRVQASVSGCRLTLADVTVGLLPDHGHLMHLFLVRMPALDRLAHLHPRRDGGSFVQALPSLPAGHYRLYADIVLDSGFPVTGTAELDLPELACGPVAGDDSVWSGALGGALSNGARVIWDRPAQLRAGVARALAFHVVEADGRPATLEPYMGMVAHAEVVRTDGSVFAHLHPNGSVAMPALELADPRAMTGMAMAMPMPPMVPAFSIPFGFPRAGEYRVFVQIKRAGTVETGAFDAHVE